MGNGGEMPNTSGTTTTTQANESGGKSDVNGSGVSQGLNQMGYKQELTRSRGLFHILFMLIAINAVPFGLASPIATSLTGGGPVTIIWGWVLMSIADLPLALSLAEICSKYPTSAGAYYWSFQLTSPRKTSRRIWASWINGWLLLVGVWTACLSVTFGTAQILTAGISIFRTEWSPAVWQTYLIFLGITLFATSVGVFMNRFLPTIDVLCACWTVLGVIIILICLPAKAAVGRHSAGFALGHFDPSASGWNPGWSFFIGLLPPAYTYAAIGMVASMAEEVHNPSVQLPLALAWIVPISFIIGLVFLLPIVFTLPDVQILLAVPGGQPLGVLFTLVMGSKGGGFGMWLIVFGVGVFCAISISCAASRATWSFARDHAIPFHTCFSKINHPLGGVPLNAYILTVTVELVLGLLFIGSSAAFNAFVGVAVICLGTSYVMPIVISLVNGREGVRDAPFGLGTWGWWLNVFAVIWMVFEIVLFSMPAVLPVTKMSMNYASVVFVGFGVISAVWYLISGRHNYKGPPIPKEISGEKDSSTS